MGGPGSGKPKVQRLMAIWYETFRMPPGSNRKYQYSVFDSIQVARTKADLSEAVNFSRAMPRIDLLVVAPQALIVVELKPKASLAEVGQVVQYSKYLARDVFIKPYLDRPMKLVLCTLQDNASVRAACEADGIEYIYIPPQELDTLPAYTLSVSGTGSEG